MTMPPGESRRRAPRFIVPVAVVAIAALFVPSANAWFREVHGRGAAR